MVLLTDEQIKQLIKEKNLKTVTDVHNALKEMFGETIQRMLEAELENELDFRGEHAGIPVRISRSAGGGLRRGWWPPTAWRGRKRR